MSRIAFALLIIYISVVQNYLGSSAELLYPGAYGDPHFTGWDGVNFDFTGEPGGIYCMLSDSSIHINMKLSGHLATFPDGHYQTYTWIKSIGILFKTHRIVMSAANGNDTSCHSRSFLNSIEVDGSEIVVEKRKKFRTTDGEVVIVYDESKHDQKITPHDSYTVVLKSTSRIRLKVMPEIPDLRTAEDSFFHFAIEMLEAKLSPEVHGVLGQTLLNARGRIHDGSYRTLWNPLLVQQQVDGPNGDGYLDGATSDYTTSGILYSDCRFSRFDTNYANQNGIVEVSSGYSRRFLPGTSIFPVRRL